MTGAENHPGDLARARAPVGVVEHWPKLAVGQVGQSGGGQRVAQQALRRKDDERARSGEAASRLAAQEVEVLRRGGAIDDLKVVLSGKLQEPLRTRALECSGPWPSSACGRSRTSPARLIPLGLAGRDELVDQHLGHVGEVAELGFPEHQRVARLDAVAVLEAERSQPRPAANRTPRTMARASGKVCQRRTWLSPLRASWRTR